MRRANQEILQNFDAHSLPDLDVAVLGALELFEEVVLPPLPRADGRKFLVVGSGNAAVIGRILFEDFDARFADESTYVRELTKSRAEDGTHFGSAVIISASGGKHAVSIAHVLQEQEIATWLLTNNEDAPARTYIDSSQILVFPKNREPYTYNVSTYMGMLLSKTHEDPEAIRQCITDTVAPKIPDTLAQFDAFYFIIPPEFILLKELFLTKFDELFGSRVSARVFTLEQSKHAKTIVSSPKECFISFGDEASMFGGEDTRMHIPLPESAGPAAMMAVGYYVIGQIQKQHPPYFKDNIEAYTKKASEMFKESIASIVE